MTAALDAVTLVSMARAPIVLGISCVILGAAASAAAATNVACIGDSITAGAGLTSPATQAYPPVLGGLLGADYTVKNFGVSGTTMLKNGDFPYWNTTQYTDSGTFGPNIVLIMLGTNDSKPQNWALQAQFDGDYTAMIQHYRDLGATVYAVLPPPVYDPGAFNISPSVLDGTIVPRIAQIASATSTPVIDVFDALSNHLELFPDTVHPNAAGDQLIAQTVFDALVAGGAGGTSGAGGHGGASTAGASGSGTGGSMSATGGSGCSCRTAPRGDRAPWWIAVAAVWFARSRRRSAGRT